MAQLNWWERLFPRRVRAHAEAERLQLERQAIADLLPVYVQRWRRESGFDSWRLPPDNWIYEMLAVEHPEFDLSGWPSSTDRTDLRGEVSSMSQLFDFVVRESHEGQTPTPSPFLPITQRRRINVEHVRGLEAQETANLKAFTAHAAALNGHKHNNASAPLQALFLDPAITTAVPNGTIVYHQIRRPPRASTTGRSSYRAANASWSFDAHCKLKAGDIVRYTHIRSATTKVWWFSSLDPDPEWLGTGRPENGIRLELAPERGVYLSSQSAGVVQTHLGNEDELILPAGTYWEVVGVKDVVQSNSRSGRPTGERLRAVQMRELPRGSVVPSTVIELTAPSV